MTKLCDETLAHYARSALRLHGLDLPADAEARVIEQFLRVAAVAGPMLARPFDAHDAPAPVYRP
ncbi:AtzG-like protein [Cupriavidus basilensis]|uniref:AtzG-like protein n=1 Tax=Cupriavidus TaxID=106589 RepID=UPI00044E9841|nr:MULTISPECIES: AtzG-like protein [Cupriavidus]KDP83533.1 hypothetical protein CF70_024275 [Cupriavidus sp. SK-3]MDF3882767.1 DUF4089 domain-containing protein [Cupriavidus basilensis]